MISLFNDSLSSLLESCRQAEQTLSPEETKEVDRLVARFLRRHPIEALVYKENMSMKREREEVEGSLVFEKMKKRRTCEVSSGEQISFNPIKNPLKRQAEESSAAPVSKKGKTEMDELIRQFSQLGQFPAREESGESNTLKETKKEIASHPVESRLKRKAKEIGAAPASKRSKAKTDFFFPAGLR